MMIRYVLLMTMFLQKAVSGIFFVLFFVKSHACKINFLKYTHFLKEPGILGRYGIFYLEQNEKNPSAQIGGSYKKCYTHKNNYFFAKSRMSDTCFATPSFIFYKKQ